MTTIYDIAEKAGVSITTVSRVINNHPYVKDSTREKVEKLLEETGYLPNSNASSLVKSRTKTIAVILPDITNNFFSTLFHGIEERANEANFAVIFGNTNEEIKKEKEYIKMFIERRVDGIILDPILKNTDILDPILKNKIPMVILDRELKDVEVNYVSSNNRESAYELTNYLIKEGHEKIALISALQRISVFKERTAGYIEALKNAGIEINKDYIKFGDKPVKEVGYSLAKSLIETRPRPTAIFASNNFLATGAINALWDMDIKVPDDMAVVCFDVVDDASVLYPFITSMNQPAYKMGYIAADLLIKEIKEEIDSYEKVFLESSLYIRQST